MDFEGDRSLSSFVDLGHYELLEKLGQGGMGAVYRARHRKLGREVAIKFILLGKWASSGQRERFAAEISAIAQLDHPNIVPVYECGEADGQQFFAMKFVSGGTLAERVNAKENRVSDQAPTIETLVKISRAVEHAHVQGVLHRDLKPGNVLLDQSGEPYLSDFGLAASLSGDQLVSLTSGAIGTPHYMAPETLAEDEPVTVAADVYGLGAILYELLCGRPPFHGTKSVLEIVKRTQQVEPERPRKIEPAIDRNLETICLHAMAKEPGRRYRSAGELAEDLERFQRGEPINAREVGILERTVLWTQRRPGIAAMLMLCGLLVAAVIVVQFLANRRVSHSNEIAQASLARTQSVLAGVYVDEAENRWLKGDPMGALPWMVAAMETERANPARLDSYRRRMAGLFSECPQLEQMCFLGEGEMWSQISLSPDGRRVAAASNAGVAQIWDIETGRPGGETDAAYRHRF